MSNPNTLFWSEITALGKEFASHSDYSTYYIWNTQMVNLNFAWEIIQAPGESK